MIRRSGVIEMVHGREAVLQAEAQAQMLQGRKVLVDDSQVTQTPSFYIGASYSIGLQGRISRISLLRAPDSHFGSGFKDRCCTV